MKSLYILLLALIIALTSGVKLRQPPPGEEFPILGQCHGEGEPCDDFIFCCFAQRGEAPIEVL